MTKNPKTSDTEILAWAGWYPTSFVEQGIFVKKHLELLGQEYQLRTFHIAHKNHPYTWFKKEQLEESFGTVNIYYIPKLFLIKHLAYFFIPLLESRKQNSKTIFHLHCTFPYAIFTLLIPLFSHKKFVATEHWGGFTDASGLFNKQPKLTKLFYKQAIKRFGTITVVSPFLKQQLLKKIDHPNITVVPNVLGDFNKPINKKSKTEIFRLLSIGNLEDNVKNFSLLLEVCHNLKKTAIDFTLDIFGSGKDENKLTSKAENLGLLNKNVFFKGYIDNALLQDQYAQYDAFILLSNYETFSIVTFESITNDLPVFISDCGGPESYVNENNGVIVSKKEPKEIADRLQAFLQAIKGGKYKEVSKSIDYEFYSQERILNLFGSIYLDND